jgi:hypothetical protein
LELSTERLDVDIFDAGGERDLLQLDRVVS